MVRHPKKKEREKKSPPSDPNRKDLPPETPKPEQTEGVKVKNPLDKLFWLRVGMGILAGILSAETGVQTDEASRPFLGLGLMIILFILSYAIAKKMNIPLPTSDKRKLIMTGIGSYFFMFLFTWILVNTLIHPEVGIPGIR